MCQVTYKRSKLLSTAYLWNMGCIFQKFDRIYNKYVFPKPNKTFHAIIHWSGSTSGAPPLTKAPLHGVCRANTYNLFFCWNPPHHMHNDVTQMCIQAQPFSTYHGKICSDHVIFILTWMPKKVQDLDLRNDADCELLSYGAYVYAFGCHLMANVQSVITSRPATLRS